MTLTVTDLAANMGDVFVLDYPLWNVGRARDILAEHPGWVQYNPRKPHIKRKGLSITSLDGGFSGIPDLDSIREYNRENGTTWQEHDFNKPTSITRLIPEALDVLQSFPVGTIGRCHFLRLDAGGFFPPHRDNGLALPTGSFRILVPLVDFDGDGQHVWLQEGKPVSLRAGYTYFINTTKVHSLFSFADRCEMVVINVIAEESAIRYCATRSKVA